MSSLRAINEVNLRILILGGTGFLGQTLVSLLNKSHFVQISSRSKPISTHHWVGADDYSAMRKFLSLDSEPVIINCVAHYGRNHEAEEFLQQTNIAYPQSVLSHLQDVQNLLFVNIGTALSAHSSLYAKTKTEFEKWLLDQTDVRAINLKTELFFGYENPPKNLVSRLIVKGLVKDNPFPMTSGVQMRDFIHVEDVASAVEFCLSHKIPKNEYHLGTGQQISIRDLAAEIQKIIPDYKTDIHWGALSEAPRESERCLAPSLQTLGWSPQLELSAGLKRTFESYTLTRKKSH